MSTNTTSTNNNGNGNGSHRPKSDASKSGASAAGHLPAAGGQELRLPFATFPMPDPETLERLANEFFLVVPSDMDDGNGATAPEPLLGAEPDEIPRTMFTEETFPLREPGVQSVPSVPPSLPPSSPGPLNEIDLRAIATSLTSSMGLIPGAPDKIPTPPTAASPDSIAEGKISPFGVAPNLPNGNEMFSFPAIPTFTSPPMSVPGGADVSSLPQSHAISPAGSGSAPPLSQGEKGGSPATSFVVPPANEWFSFPRIPAIPNTSSLQTVALPLGVPASPQMHPAAPPLVANPSVASGPTQSAIPTTVPGTNSPVPHDLKSLAPGAHAYPTERSNYSVDPSGVAVLSSKDEQSIYPGMVSSLPSPSELFSFPGIPGMQSPPGAPVIPSSVPTQTSHNEVPAVSAAGMPSAPPATSAATQKTEAVSVPGVPERQIFEFQPDLVPDLGTAKRPLDARLIRRDFPILEERIHGKQLIWLDNAATTQKPNAVIDRISNFYRHENSNIHRAAHTLAARATDAYESAREKTRRFLNASTTKEVIFVRGTTEGINLIAKSWGGRNVQKGDEVVITWLEHHANIVPWQQLCAEKGARLRVAPVNDRGEIILEEYEKLLGPRTRIVSFSQVSNALGTITPAREMVEMAHRHGACVLVDGAQAVSHMRVDVQALGCDFYVFSGHKVFGPTGIGVVYGKLDVLETMPPWQGGGNMIADVTFEKTVYQGPPARFEAGTGNIADAVGLGAALDYVDQIGMENISAYEHELLNYGTAKLLTVPGLKLVGTAREKAGVLSFVLDDIRTEDVGAALNQEGIAVRSGHHCAQPILRRMGVESTVRPSLAPYNTCEELDQLVAALLRIQAGRGHRRA